MEAKDASRTAVIYLFALSLGAQSPTAATVFYKVQGEGISQSLCSLFSREYPQTDGQPSFHCQPADAFTFDEQILLDEALEQLVIYEDTNRSLYDPLPPKDAIKRARFALRARRWENLLRQKINRNIPDPPCTLPQHMPPAVDLGRPGGPCCVLGKEKKPLTDAERAVVARLLEAGSGGLSKEALEAERSSARRILKRLRLDPDWAQVICMAGRTNGRYRIRPDVHL